MVNSKIYQETWNMYIEERVMLLSHHFFYVFSCPFDRLTIYDGPDILAEKIGKFTIHYLILIKWTNQLQAPTAAKCVTWWCSAPTTSSMSPSKRSRERRRFSTEDFLGFTSSARIMWSLVSRDSKEDYLKIPEDFTITEKAATRAFSLLVLSLLRHY